MLPRFALKHGIRVTVVDTDAEVVIEVGEMPVFAREDVGYGVRSTADSPHAETFVVWLSSEIGLRTVLSYKVDGVTVFAEPAAPEEEAIAVVLTGDALKGQDASLRACGRCHVVGEINRMAGIGSTPSFAVLRTMADWQERFEIFYVLNPHPAFTIIPEVIEEFDETRPSPIAPVTVTLEEIEDIVAYVAAMDPADLGAPIAHQ
ncbi:cytochrome c [Shimia isoporae]|nr:cytochrome c [Shimia isoporae]